MPRKQSKHSRLILVTIVMLGLVLTYYRNQRCYGYSVHGAKLKPPEQLHRIPQNFRYEKVVVVVAYNRVEYFRRTISALILADGSDSYTLIAAIDGSRLEHDENSTQGNKDIIETLHSLRKARHFKEIMVDIAASNLGTWKNKKRGVALGFEQSDFVVVLEDDIVLSKYGLRWFEWHVLSGLIFDRKEFATASCWSATFTATENDTWLHDFFMTKELQLQDRWITSDWAHQWGWAIWRQTWDEFGQNWTGQDTDLARALKKRGLYETHPMLARCNNIGAFGVNKKGTFTSHVHLRSFTSDDYHGGSLPRMIELRNQSLQNMTPAILYKWLRGGIFSNHVVQKFDMNTIQERASLARKASEGWRTTVVE